MTRALRSALALLVLAASSAPVSASIRSSWPVMALSRDQGCELELAGNGKFMELRGRGFVPGEALAFTLGSGAMKPIHWQVYADGSGRWTKLYIPFRFDAPGGMVSVWLESSRCTLVASAPWLRTVRVID
jgi:hypothetical protein